MAMNKFEQFVSRLAFQVDRKLLTLEEEDYYRMDFSAHEALAIPLKQSHSLKSAVSGLGKFTLSASIIFAVLFAATNASAYTQILKANILEASKPEISAPAAIAPETPGLEAIETTDIVPENSILPLNIAVTSYENRLQIPAIKVDVPINEPVLGLEALKSNDWNELEDQIRSSLLQGPVHYPGTAEPGEKGNVFITGHSSNVFWEPSPYNTVFALLPRLEPGDDIYITFNQEQFHYRVTEKTEVSPKNTSVLAQGDDYKLTLMTCTPVGTNLKRLIVSAELLQ